MYAYLLIACVLSAYAQEPCGPHPDELTVIEARGESNFDFGQTVGFASRFQIAARLATPEIQAALAYAATQDGAALVSVLMENSNTVFPSFVKELEGYAAGSGSSYHDIFVMNAVDELETVMPPGTFRDGHCTDVIVGPPKGAATPRLVAHNEDASIADGNLMFLLEATLPLSDNSSIFNFTAFLYAGTLASGAFAFNDAGVFFTTNGLFPLSVDAGGVPRSFVHRHILESRSLDDAVSRLELSQVACGFAMNLGAVGSTDQGGSILRNVEMSAVTLPGIVEILEGQHYYHANSYIHSDTPQIDDASSDARLARLAQLPVPQPILNTSGATLLLGDTKNSTYPVYRSGKAPDCCETVVTALFQVTDVGGVEVGTLSILNNNPHKCPAPIVVRTFSRALPASPPPSSLPNPPDSKNGTGLGYSYYCIGMNCSAPPPPGPSPLPGYVYMGGGTDVDAAFEHQIRSARGGSFVILRADSPDDALYNPYIWALAQGIGAELWSVTTIVLHERRAGKQSFVLDAVAQAGALFFAGGDQTHYVDRINDEELAAVLVARAEFASVGGTSAGSDYLGQLVFAPPESAPDITSPMALADPYAAGISFSLSPYFNPAFSTGGERRVLTDAHFVTEDRMGRNLAFLSRLAKDGNVSVGGDLGCVYLVANDESTALLVNPSTGDAVIASDHNQTLGYSISFVCSLCEQPTTCEAGTPLTAGPFSCMRLDAFNGRSSYNFQNWTGNGFPYRLSVENGTIIGSPYGPNASQPLA